MCFPVYLNVSRWGGYRKPTDGRRSNRLQQQTDGSEFTVSDRLPVWIASLLHAAKRMRSDRARRKKAYRLLQRKLMFHRVGVKDGDPCQPTYIYPEEVKILMRSVFSQDVCDYPDPCHDRVVYLTVEDLHRVDFS